LRGENFAPVQGGYELGLPGCGVVVEPEGFSLRSPRGANVSVWGISGEKRAFRNWEKEGLGPQPVLDITGWDVAEKVVVCDFKSGSPFLSIGEGGCEYRGAFLTSRGRLRIRRRLARKKGFSSRSKLVRNWREEGKVVYAPKKKPQNPPGRTVPLKGVWRNLKWVGVGGLKNFCGKIYGAFAPDCVGGGVTTFRGERPHWGSRGLSPGDLSPVKFLGGVN